MIYKPRHAITLEVPKNTSDRTNVTRVMTPLVISSEWTRNSHLLPDELKITIDARDGGLDVRSMRNARCSFYLADMSAGERPFDLVNDLRFAGILSKPGRKLSDDSFICELAFLDYTTLFLESKPFPADLVPKWTDTLTQAWTKICQGTGYFDPSLGHIVSSVDALQDNLVFSNPADETMTLGDMVPGRFHAISAPTPPQHASSWVVWQWIVSALGLISYIDRTSVIVARVLDHYSDDPADGLPSPPAFLWGQNIMSLDENADAAMSSKGLILRSFDPLRGTLIESAYPPPDDPRVKHPRIRSVPKSAKSKGVTQLDALADYEIENYPACVTQEILDQRTRSAWEERRRQELKGRVVTHEINIFDRFGNSDGSILDLAPGDSVRVDFDPETRDVVERLDTTARRQYLIDRGYRPDVADVILQNENDNEGLDPTFHVESLTTRLGPTSWEAELSYHNLIKPIEGGP